MRGSNMVLGLFVLASIGACGDDGSGPQDPPPPRLSKVSGDQQNGLAGETLPDSIAVRVRDAAGTGVSGVAVAFEAGGAGGSISPSAAVTDASGTALASWTLGPKAGTYTVSAQAADLPGSPATFTATATPNGRITGTITLTRALQSRSRVPGGITLARGRPRDARSVRKRPDGWGSTRRTIATGSRSGSSTRDEYVPGSLIVTYRSRELNAPKPGASAYASRATARAVAETIRGDIAAKALTHRFQVRGISPSILAARVRVQPDRIDNVRTALLQDPAVRTVERERIAYATAPPRRISASVPGETLPNDPLYARQAWHYAAIDMPAAWNITTGSENVLVAVVDDGIRFDHPSVAGNLTNDGYDFVSFGTGTVCGVDTAGDGDGYDADPTVPSKFDESACVPHQSAGHGLHVAGTIGAAGNDAYGVTGVAWSVRVRPVRVLGIGGSGGHYDIAQGILYAAGLPADDGMGGQVQASEGARIINLSLSSDASSAELQAAVSAAASAGALIVAAAGNDGVSDPRYPASYAEVVSVAAVGPDLELASYSNFGPTVDIAAPGGDLSDGNNTFGVASSTWNFQTSQPNHDYLNGTSMAAPHVTGVAALLLAADPTLTADELRAHLLDYAVDLGPLGRDDQFGHGLLNARNSLARSRGPERDLYAQLYSATLGNVVQTVSAEPDGKYLFPGLVDGSYYVFAGMDQDSDRQIGVPGRQWGAYGNGTGAPSTVTVMGAGTQATSFTIGFPSESEPNDSATEADRLALAGYMYGTFPTTDDVDVYRITLPAGNHVFETFGWDGACGYAYEADTVLELYDDNGQLVAVNDDADASARDYCSRIALSLTAGSYELRVKWVGGGGGYRVYAYREF
ncbi:MAG: S8 family serine peptidase [Longimicrobiales bacterium]